MAKPTTVKEAVKKFEEANSVEATEAERVRDTAPPEFRTSFDSGGALGSDSTDRENGRHTLVTQKLRVKTHSIHAVFQLLCVDISHSRRTILTKSVHCREWRNSKCYPWDAI